MLSSKDNAFVFLKQYVVASIKKDKKGYFIGFIAVFLVTFFLAFFQATISNVRFVFLKTAMPQNCAWCCGQKWWFPPMAEIVIILHANLEQFQADR